MRAASNIVLALGLCSAPGPLLAGSTGFTVQATVVPGCEIVGQATPSTGARFGLLNFGMHPSLVAGDYSATAVLAGSPVKLHCTSGAAVTMSIDAGLHAVGGQRRMRSGTHYLPYSLSTQANGSTLIQPGTPMPVNASAGPTLLPIHGHVSVPNGGQHAGHYTDTLQILISW